MTRTVAGVELGHGDRQGLVLDRGGLRLPLRPVLPRRRRRPGANVGKAARRLLRRQVGRTPLQLQARWAESQFRFLYKTDGGYNEYGAFLDDIAIKSSVGTFTDGAEAGDNGWTARRLDRLDRQRRRSTPTATTCIENRQYVGYDETLREGPYQFSNGLTTPNWVEFFPFQDGMLVWYVDKSYTDNNVSAHPGAGYAMVGGRVPELADLPGRHEPEQPSRAVRRDVRPRHGRPGLPPPGGRRRHQEGADRADPAACATAAARCSGDVRRHRPERATTTPRPRRTRSRWQASASRPRSRTTTAVS